MIGFLIHSACLLHFSAIIRVEKVVIGSVVFNHRIMGSFLPAMMTALESSRINVID